MFDDRTQSNVWCSIGFDCPTFDQIPRKFNWPLYRWSLLHTVLRNLRIRQPSSTFYKRTEPLLQTTDKRREESWNEGTNRKKTMGEQKRKNWEMKRGQEKRGLNCRHFFFHFRAKSVACGKLPRGHKTEKVRSRKLLYFTYSWLGLSLLRSQKTACEGDQLGLRLSV